MRWRWDPDPFGTTASDQNPESLGTFVYNLRMPGQVYLAETGLSYNMGRDYDAAIGRYNESDPIGQQGGINTYGYVFSSPVMFADPLGLDVYRGPGNYYSDIPPTSGCERAMFSGDYIVGWGLCAPPPRSVGVPRHQSPGFCPSPPSDAEFDWEGMLWDLARPDWTWLIPEAKGYKLLSALAAAKRFSSEKQALVDMAKLDKRFGVSRTDMEAYRELNRGLPDPFPDKLIRIDPGHPRGGPHSQLSHGHVGPVDHIPITDP